MFNMEEIMSQANAFQQKMRDDLAKMAITKTSGGGAVTVVINGNKEVTKIEFGANGPADREVLADHVLAALNAAYDQVDQEVKNRMPDLGNIDLSAIMDMFKK